MSPLQDADLAAAVALGWRVAELYSLVDDDHDCSPDTLLPAHSGLARADQLELQLRAAAGDAKRAGVTSKPASLAALVAVARESAEGHVQREAFRTQLRACHVEINKDLWSMNEALGKAYELGNGLSDTYGRVCRGYREPGADHALVWRARVRRGPHRAPEEAARRPAVAARRDGRQRRARAARQLARRGRQPHRGGRPARPRRRPQGPAPADRDLAPADRGRQAARGVPGRRAARPRPRHAARPRLEALPHVAAPAGGGADRADARGAQGPRLVRGEPRPVGARVRRGRRDRRARDHPRLGRPDRAHAPARMGRPAVAPRGHQRGGPGDADRRAGLRPAAGARPPHRRRDDPGRTDGCARRSPRRPRRRAPRRG